MAGKVTFESIQGFIKANSSRFDRYLDKLKVVSAGEGGCVAELKVGVEHSNCIGTLHGGCAATLVDVVSSYGLLSHKNCCVPAVTVDLHTTYIRSAPIGEEIVIDSKAVKTGKTLAFLEVLITNKKNGQLLVKGTHTRFLMRPQD